MSMEKINSEELNGKQARIPLSDDEMEQVAGGDIIDTAPGQLEAYLSGAYTQRIGTDMPEVERAVTD